MFCALLLTTACQQQPAEMTGVGKSITPADSATGDVAPAAAPTLAQRVSPIISGYWVNADYLKEVARTRSPAASFDSIESPSSLVISPFTQQKDSVEIGASYGLHEGGNLTLFLRPYPQPDILRVKAPYQNETTTTSELTYRITATDTTLFYVTKKSKTRQIVGKMDYQRTGRATGEADLETGVARGVNNLLTTGFYNGVDSLSQPVRVQFLTNGTVKGLPFRKYYIETDFTGPNPGDAIYFDVYTKQQQQLGASFGRDTLKLYTIHSTIGTAPGETDTTELFTRGRLRYQLVRVKKP